MPYFWIESIGSKWDFEELRANARSRCCINLTSANDAPDDILESFWDMNEQPDKVREFAGQLFAGTVGRIEEIDKLIQQHTKNWRLNRMAAVDRNVLRLAVFELLSGDKDTEDRRHQ